MAVIGKEYSGIVEDDIFPYVEFDYLVEDFTRAGFANNVYLVDNLVAHLNCEDPLPFFFVFSLIPPIFTSIIVKIAM